MVNPLIPRPLFTSNSPLQALLTRLHRISLAQEAEGYGGSSSASITPNRQGGVIYPNQDATSAELSQFKEKLVALDEDKASFVNLTLKAMGAQRVFEAGTSFGVSTLYLVDAIRANRSIHGPLHSGLPAKVWGTELELSKSKIATSHILSAFTESSDPPVSEDFHLLEGDILETIPKVRGALDEIDALLLDIWAPMALPVLKLLEPRIRKGGVVFVDNCTSGKDRYKELDDHLNREGSGWHCVVIPFRDGFKMAVKTCV